MRLLFRLLLLLSLTAVLGTGALLWFGLSDQGQVSEMPRLSHQDIARAKRLIEQNDPRKLPAGAERRLTLSEDDLNLAANYLLQTYARGNAWVGIGPQVVHVEASVRLAYLPRRSFLNLSMALAEGPDGPRVTRLKLGQVSVPDFLSGLLVRELAARIGRNRGASLALASIKEFELSDRRLSLLYEWRPELIDAVRDDLMPAGQGTAMAAYYNRLAELHAAGKAARGSLAEALPPLFALAAERSRQQDPVVENRALLAVLGAWASHHGMDRLLPPDRRNGRLARFRLQLQRRTDFGQHFLTSAALAANADTLLSDAVGLYKEVSDSQGGSGFSFTDIAADRAGTRFGEIAVASPRQARRLQQRIADGIAEDHLMPPARDLPEHMNAAEFERRFGGVDSPAYRRMMAEIEGRIERLPLYR